MVTHAEASPVSEPAAPFVGIILHVETLPARRPGGWSTGKCERCYQAPWELAVRYWSEDEIGTPGLVRVCRRCLSDVEVTAWREGTFYRVRPADGPARPLRVDRPLKRKGYGARAR